MNIPVLSLLLAALGAWASLVPGCAQAQIIADPLDDLRPRQSDDVFDEDERTRRRERGSNGLRGRFEPERTDDFALSGERIERTGEDGLRGTSNPDTQIVTRDGQQDSDSAAQEQQTGVNRRRRQVRDTDGRETQDVDRDLVIEEDPFAALGVRAGSFLFFPVLGAERVYMDNVFLSTRNPESDWAYELTPSLLIQSDWSRHSLTANVSGVRSYHERFKTEDDKTFAADVTGQLDIRHDTNLVGRASYSEAFEDRSSSDFPTGAVLRPKVRNRDVSLEGNHTFNRVTVTLRGELSDEDFSDNPSGGGGGVDEDSRDFTERRIIGRAAYEFQPGVAAFFETSTNERDFAQPVDSGGLRNGSSGYDVQAGLSFRLLGKLTGEASAGYAVQKPDEPALGNVDGLIFNAGLEWKATGLTTFRLDASSEIDESTRTDTAGSLVREVEVSVEHRPRRNIIAGASLGYEHEKFASTGLVEETWEAGLTGEYLFTRSVALTVDYDHVRRISNDPGNDYTANEVRFGVRVRR